MSQEESPEVPISEMYEKYKGRWVAVSVTKRDKNGQPLLARLVSQDVDRYRLRQNIGKYNDICIFFAGEPPFPLFL